MLRIVKELHAEYVRRSPTGKSVDELKPLKIAQETIRAMAKELDIPDAKRIKVDFFDEKGEFVAAHHFGASKFKGRPYVFISPFCLVDFEKISMQEQEIVTQVAKACGEDSHKVSKQEKGEIKFVLASLKTSTAKEQLLFSLGHELAHLYHGDCDASDQATEMAIIILDTLLFILLDLGLGVGLIALGTAVPAIAPMVPLVLIVAGITSLVFQFYVTKKSIPAYHHYREFRADAFAIKAFGAEGAIARYKLLKKHFKDKSSSTHPKMKDRLARMRALHA